MALPLEGIRVLDLSQWVFGPATAAVLGDWGAEVVHIEDPNGGDPMRGLQSMVVIRMADVNFAFEFVNRNKKSLCVDIKQKQGQEVLHKLVQKSDVFVSSLRKNVLERLGLDYDILALFVRERTGIGQGVNLSLLGTGIWMAGLLIQGALATGEDFPQLPRKAAGNPLYNAYQAKDGRWLQLVSLPTDRYWRGFCKAIDKPELEHDPRFDSHQKRSDNNITLISIIDEVLATRTVEEWARRFDENGVVWGLSKTILK